MSSLVNFTNYSKNQCKIQNFQVRKRNIITHSMSTDNFDAKTLKELLKQRKLETKLNYKHRCTDSKY